MQRNTKKRKLHEPAQRGRNDCETSMKVNFQIYLDDAKGVSEKRKL